MVLVAFHAWVLLLSSTGVQGCCDDNGDVSVDCMAQIKELYIDFQGSIEQSSHVCCTVIFQVWHLDYLCMMHGVNACSVTQRHMSVWLDINTESKEILVSCSSWATLLELISSRLPWLSLPGYDYGIGQLESVWEYWCFLNEPSEPGNLIMLTWTVFAAQDISVASRSPSMWIAIWSITNFQVTSNIGMKLSQQAMQARYVAE